MIGKRQYKDVMLLNLALHNQIEVVECVAQYTRHCISKGKGTPVSFATLVLNPPLSFVPSFVLLPSLILLLLLTFATRSLLSFLPSFRSLPNLILISSRLVSISCIPFRMKPNLS